MLLEEDVACGEKILCLVDVSSDGSVVYARWLQDRQVLYNQAGGSGGMLGSG